MPAPSLYKSNHIYSGSKDEMNTHLRFSVFKILYTLLQTDWKNEENDSVFNVYQNLVFSRPAPALYKSDHIYPGSKDAPVTVILYGEMGTAEFRSFHTVLSGLADKKEITYVLRHYRKVE